MALAACAILIGTGATALTDVWAIVRKRLLGMAAPDYGLVGRWFAHMAQGRFFHESIASAAAVRGERPIGWTAHYLIGIAYASVLLAVWGGDWVRHPTLVPALVVGIGSVAAPFLLMQPAMGAGIAASRTAQPGVARLHSLIMHAVFGVGLYVTGLLASVLAT